MTFTQPDSQKRLVNRLLGKRVSIGSRPYPYIYKTSEGKVTDVSFNAQGWPTVVTDAGEVWNLQSKGDLDLISEV